MLWQDACIASLVRCGVGPGRGQVRASKCCATVRYGKCYLARALKYDVTYGPLFEARHM